MELYVEPIDSRSNVFYLAFASVVLAVAQSRTTEIEAQHGKSEVVQRFHRVKYDLVVQGSTEQRMRMTDDCSVCCVFRACVEQGFQTSGWTIEKERANR